MLAERLTALGHSIFVTREPGATVVGKEIRALILGEAGRTLTPKAELLLFAADRAQHVETVIRPKLESGTIILCDRYVHSTLAYQGFGRGIERTLLDEVNTLATDGLMPHLVLLLDIEPEVGLKRARKRGETAESWTRFEQEELEFHRRLRNGFLSLSKEGSQWCVLDATRPVEKSCEEALARIQALRK